ncbi:MAG: SPFH domain-containing protein [Caldilineaceae bacterium]|nr:SPFH domain-containing protein [Caldilineaceae bacterium]
MTVARGTSFSRIKEAATAWDQIQQMLRSGDKGYLVPVVIPRDRRGFGWVGLLAVALYLVGTALAVDARWVSMGLLVAGIFLGLLALVWFWRQAVVVIEQGTTGILSRFGAVTGTLGPGRHFLWWPWLKVDAIVDTSTEFPYTAPVLASPTRENIPLKSIEFFLKFRIEDPVRFVRNIGAGNFDVVLSNVVQDAIRRRSRLVETERAYDLRSSDVGDMQEYLNRHMEHYGVRITGANIPDVQLPDQYQQNLATRERVAKELNAYEKEWELTRRQRIDTLLMEIERAKKERDARVVEARSAVNKAREDIALMLQEQELEAEKIRWDIEARGRSTLNAAENESKAMQHLGQSYQDNRALLQYQLARRRLQVAEKLMLHAPRPLLVNSQGQESSALSTLLLARLLPTLVEENGKKGMKDEG